MSKNLADLLRGQCDRQPPRGASPSHVGQGPQGLEEHLAVEKEQGGQRLILGRRRDTLTHGEIREEGLRIGSRE